MTKPSRASIGPLIATCVLVLLIAACYFPGLGGGYVFDDEVNILQNKQLRLDSLSLAELRGAAMSGNAGPLGRPIALVSFALNLYLTGADPFFLKLTNLLIHLCNTLVVGCLAAVLLRALAPGQSKETGSWLWGGWLVAALWGLHPLNLTSVLYVVQRMTSLSTLFGLLALLLYGQLRSHHISSGKLSPTGTGLTGLLVLVLLAASALTKESGLLFVPLLLWIEYLVFRFRLGDVPLTIVQRVISVALAGGIVVVVFMMLPRMLGPGAYSNRDFTLPERAMTEARVLVYYLRLFVLPRSSELSLYHDDIETSTGLIDPPTTILSIAALLGITIAAIYWRRKFPVALFGWGWFLISHSLESTIFPLEIAHEHRNYFATIGLLMCVPSAVRPLRGQGRRIALGALAAYLSLLSFVTFTRAQQWSSYVDLALLEVSNHPRSARANYELGRTYLALMESTNEPKFGAMAEEALRTASTSYRPGLGPLFGLVHVAYYRGQEPDPRVIFALKDGLRTLPFYNGNSSFLQAFLVCQVDQRCKMPDQEAISLFIAALGNPNIPLPTKAEIYKQLAQYYINRTGDLDKGVALIGDAVAVHDQATTRIMLAQAYGMKGEYENALAQLDRATALDQPGIYDRLIQRERSALEKAAQQTQ